ncbi:aminoglycoside phosphotransferase family protein [Sporosarcina contaminans]|uniref:Aminoglycoside phosphotransferase family protein n=1 Tax=Sporosarcina contaminans TaxID=633403 RepID=A0ABW3TUY1_9BACL
MDIPKEFQQKICSCFGKDGEKWLLTLNERVNHVADNWGLTIKAPVSNLSYNYVLNVTDAQQVSYILKLGVPNFDCRNEMKTVQLYNGIGCANIVKWDEENGAILLEKIDPGTMLSEVTDDEQATTIFTAVWMKLRRDLPIDDNIPMITEWATALTRYIDNYKESEGKIPNEFVYTATKYIKELMDTSDGYRLLHGDLHHENILYSESRGWLAIDPKGVGGDPYFDLISYLINHLMEKQDPKSVLHQRVNQICELLQLDCKRLLKAAVGMSTLYACWALEDGDPYWETTFQCAEWFQEFLEKELDVMNL